MIIYMYNICTLLSPFPFINTFLLFTILKSFQTQSLNTSSFFNYIILVTILISIDDTHLHKLFEVKEQTEREREVWCDQKVGIYLQREQKCCHSFVVHHMGVKILVPKF